MYYTCANLNKMKRIYKQLQKKLFEKKMMLNKKFTNTLFGYKK